MSIDLRSVVWDAPDPGSIQWDDDKPKKPAKPTAAGAAKAPAQTYDPTEGMSTFDRGAAGLGKAIVDTGRGIAGLFGADNRAAIEESRRLDAPLMNTGAGMAGNIGGHIGMALLPGGALKGAGVLASAARAPGAASALGSAGSALIAPTTIKGAAALGAGVGATQPALDMGERAQNVGLGALAGGGGTAALQGLARVVRPNTAPNVQALLAEGVTPTPGQILGGGFKRAEEGLASIPIIGDAIKRGQTRAVEQLNAAAFNRALAPIGEKLPKGVQGRAAVEYVGDTLGKRYEALLPRLTTQADGEFMGELQSLQGMMRNGSIDPAKAAQFDALVQNQVLAKFQPGANGAPTLTGQTMKGIETDLGQLASKFGRSLDPDQQLVGDALQELQAMLRGAVTRSNPGAAPELKKLNEGWANFKRVQKAAGALGSDEGLFSAAQLQSAVKATDRSKDKARFAEGKALMQDLSDTGKAVLGPKVPDSGTPYRSMAALLAGGAGAGMAAGPGAMAGVAAAPLLYSSMGQNALAALLTKRPDLAKPVANALRRLGPAAAMPLAVGMTTHRQ